MLYKALKPRQARPAFDFSLPNFAQSDAGGMKSLIDSTVVVAISLKVFRYHADSMLMARMFCFPKTVVVTLILLTGQSREYA